ncbi:MAG: hypothetical protein NC123_18265 [Butyrivibrio sp.]|nr:hypothetical protein [Acetatifactor muris]MCM1561457.1 hypothetical protein [Butyrivibrio sp.]
MDLLKLEEVAGGALQEKANVAMQKVIDNMQDPNTPWKPKRKITIELSFTQTEDRDDAAVEVSVNTKLAPVSPVVTRMSIGKDLSTGEPYVYEYGKQVRGQMSLDLGQPGRQGQTVRIGNDAVDPETGEVIADSDNNNVIDLRKGKAAL